MNIHDFISEVQRIHKTGAATEHSYRSALQDLLSSTHEDVVALNEPKRVKCGAPDFLVSRGEIVIGHVEAKDIDKDLRTLKGTEADQKQRYLKALPNLVYTNCLDFEFYREGALINRISIADLVMGIEPKPENYGPLENQLKDFVAQRPQTITSSEKLAEIMAGKAALIRDVLFNALCDDKDQKTELAGQYRAFQEHLIHDITREDFADIYAETVAYGMFAARLHDESVETFSRAEALELLPKSNPFLRALFTYIAGPNLDERIRWIIDDLADVFQAANVKKIMENFGSLTGQSDPFLHFYETFLAKYNPAKRKARGVWYTPEPVVNFIVRAVDEVLKTEFDLPTGLADTSKLTIDWDTGQRARTKKGSFKKSGDSGFIKKEVHRVQILDPAIGTGTFLAEVIKHIAPSIKGLAPGMWSGYIEKDLVPRLHGFELLMASYAMCHMKLDMVLSELGYKPSAKPPRLSVYLTNSLEEGEPANQTLPFAQWLSNEVKEAHAIKRDMPIMVVIGNPPYSGESANKGDWIMSLMEAYKKEPGGKERLKERNPKWINDDYVKFIRLAEHLVEKNGDGVLGLITNHGYLDNPTFRGMRWHLLNTFDCIYVLDLHGNAKKKETTPEGKADKNVFDIQQGVAIIIAAKKSTPRRRKGLAAVFHGDLWGERKAKYQTLWSSGLSSDLWAQIEPRAPQYVLAPRDYSLEKEYAKGFGIDEFMPLNSVGIVTARDALTIDFDRQTLWSRVQDLAHSEPEDARAKYKLGKDVQDWSVASAQADIRAHLTEERVVPLVYRPFDTRWTFYTGTSRGFHCRPREEVMQHYAGHQNIGLLVPGSIRDPEFHHVFVTPTISEVIFLSGTTASNAKSFPLYLYPSDQDLDQTRRTNFNPELYARLQELAQDQAHGAPDELAVFDYIYGGLHCPAYRKTYQDLLRRDFPRVPWPKSPKEFWQISEKGGKLRRLHLMEPAAIGHVHYPFCGEGNADVTKPTFKDGKIWINKTQFFDEVPEVAWSFPIGGYQPAQKWLKDRKKRQLSFDDVTHYQRIIKVLSETDSIMKTIEFSA